MNPDCNFNFLKTENMQFFLTWVHILPQTEVDWEHDFFLIFLF